MASGKGIGVTYQEELINNARATHLRMVMDENKKFRLQLKAVRELHGPIDIGGDLECRECPMSAYPCRTLQALDGEQND